MDRSEDQPVELIEATESDRSTGISDQCASGLAGWRNAHPRHSYGGLQESVMLTLIEKTPS